MSDDPVERLARVLYEASTLGLNPEGDWDGRANKGYWHRVAAGCIAKGVTLAAPAVVSPIEAAAEAAAKYVGDDKGEMVARAVLAAAVGALDTEGIRNALAGAFGECPGAYYHERFRAALLAALTGEGAK